MKKITIGARKHAEELNAYLTGAREKLEAEGVRLVGEISERGKYTFYTYRVVGTQVNQADDVTERAAVLLAQAVAEFVTEVWERHEMQQIVASNFYYYAADEVEYITHSAVKMLSDLLGPDGRPLRLSHIVNVVLEQMISGTDLLVDGLLAFRLRELRQDLPKVIEQAIDEYLMDLEYQEFVKLLRYFLDVQESNLDLVHMLCVNESTIRLFDEAGACLPVEQSWVPRPHVHQEDIPQVEDLLLSSLISLAPKQLVIHVGPSDNPPPMSETVRKIFLEKATVCTDCPLCQVTAESGAAKEWEAVQVTEL